MFGVEPWQVNHWSRANTVSPSSKTEARGSRVDSLNPRYWISNQTQTWAGNNFWSHKDTGPGPNGDPSSWSTSREQAFSVVCVCVRVLHYVIVAHFHPSCPVECQSVSWHWIWGVCFYSSGSEKTRGALGSPIKTDNALQCCQNPRQQFCHYRDKNVSVSCLQLLCLSESEFKQFDSFYLFMYLYKFLHTGSNCPTMIFVFCFCPSPICPLFKQR